jgi:hypothetical protein
MMTSLSGFWLPRAVSSSFSPYHGDRTPDRPVPGEDVPRSAAYGAPGVELDDARLHGAECSNDTEWPEEGQGQARRIGKTARSVAWCSASIWSAPDGSGLLTLEGSSIWSDPVGSRRIVWMIKRMIKPCDAAPSATRPRRPLWGRHQIFPSGDSWRTGMRNCRGPE